MQYPIRAIFIQSVRIRSTSDRRDSNRHPKRRDRRECVPARPYTTSQAVSRQPAAKCYAAKSAGVMLAVERAVPRLLPDQP